MIAYILKVSLCWLFFYGIYELFLKKKTFFNANRSYLLSTLCIGIVLPLLEFIPWKTESNMAYVIYPVLMEIDDLQMVVTSAQVEEKFNWMNVLYILYASGVIVSLLRFILGLKKIVDLFKNSEKIVNKCYTLVMTDKVHLPFSFFRWVFLSKKMELNEEVDQVMEHEIEHIKGKHSLDVIATEILKIAFWCSPMIYLYKNALREVHEYLADNIVVNKSDKISYKKLLVKQTNNSLQLALTHQFFNSHLKNRLKMINQKRSGRPTLVMYALGIPVLLLLLFAFTNSLGDKESSLTFDAISSDEGSGEFENVNYSLHAHSEYFADIYEDLHETDQTKMPYIQINSSDVPYPISDHIEMEGNIENLTIMSPEEAVKVYGEKARLGYVNLINPTFKNWNEEIARSIYEELQGRKSMDTIPAVQQKAFEIKGEIFKVVEQMPRFPGCEEMEGDDKTIEDCAKQKMLEFIYKNVRYPKEARIAGVEGMSVVSFIVTKEGNITDIKLLRDLGKGTGEESMKVVANMQGLADKWTPGYQRGEAVNVKYVLPIRFKLEGDEEVAEKEEVVVESDDSSVIDRIVVVGFKPEQKIEGEVFKVVEQMPRFPGCEDMDGSDKEKDMCAKRKMLEYIYTNLKYPKEARDQGIEGMSVVQFIVTKDGDIRNVELIRKLGGGTDEQTIAVTKSMDNMAEKWTPGYQRGEAVNVKYTLPVRFKLSAEDKKVEESKGLTLTDSDKFSGDEMRLKADKIVVEGFSNEEFKPYIIVDEEEYNGSIEELNPDKIASVNVYKGDKAFALYGEKGNNGVIEVYTKDFTNKTKSDKSTAIFNGEPWNPVYVLNGKVVDFDKTKFIDRTNVTYNSYRGAAATEKFGEIGKNGVMEIITKPNATSLDAEKKTVTIKGKVTDKESGKPLIGTNVVVQDAQIGTVTDLGGNYELTCPAGSVLQFSYVGYEAYSEARSGKSNMDVALTKINGDQTDVAKNVVEKKLEGKAAGVPIYLDGKRVVTNTEWEKKRPLFVVDGIVKSAPVDDELNPDEIEAISVLKGAKAIAKYGEKGLNGVIEITTKKQSHDKKKKSAFNGNEVDQMPFFPGCSNIRDIAEKNSCSQQKLLNFIYSNVKYPKQAKNKGIEGMVVTTFTINADGRVKNIELLRDVDGLSKSALAAVAEMDEQNIIWEPALLDGNPVAMKYTLPIKYKLSDECEGCEEKVEERSVSDLKFETFNAYPNPAKEFLNLSFKGERLPIEVQLLDIDGKALYQENVSDFDGVYEGKINVKNMDANMLILRIQQNGKVFTQKIIVE